VSRTDQEHVFDALDHIAVLHDHLARGEMADSLIADAVCLRLAAAIDSVAQTTPNFRDRGYGLSTTDSTYRGKHQETLQLSDSWGSSRTRESLVQ